MIPFFNLIEIKVCVVNYKSVIRQIESWISSNGKTHIIVAANTHVIVETRRNNYFKQVVEKADLVIPDGMPVAMVGRMRGFPSLKRVDGPGLMAAVLEAGQRLGWRHYFYGGSSETLTRLEENIKIRWPKIRIAGSFTPPFRPLSIGEDKAIVSAINASGADIIWVGLGCPKQEYWMAEHHNKVNVSVMLGVGQAFDLLAGVKKRAPRWMQNSGLEWLFRLMHEPKRLWKRYLVNNSLFLCYLFREQIGITLRKYKIIKKPDI